MFTMRTERVPTIRGVVITLDGACDFTVCDRFREDVDTIVGDGGVVNAVFDCSGMSFIASIGLGVLVGAHATLRTRGGGVTLVGVAKGIHHGVTSTRLDALFRVFGTLDEAVASLGVS